MRELHVTSPLMAGQDVLDVQKKLKVLGYGPGPLDGRYGPATFMAVKAFQKANRLQVDGVVGAETQHALSGRQLPEAKKPPVRRPGSPTPGQLMLEVATTKLGVKESPAGSNHTEFGVWFGVDRVAWCNIFVSWAALMGPKVQICRGFKGAGVYSKGCAYCPTTEAWLRSIGTWIGKGTPSTGMLALYHFGHAEAIHIGIVERWLGGGKFTAIEGNTAVGNDSNGGEVMRRDRYVSEVRGFGSIK
jgi:hypothetical protein